jgi:hypothetical protein
VKYIPLEIPKKWSRGISMYLDVAQAPFHSNISTILVSLLIIGDCLINNLKKYKIALRESLLLG